MAVLALVVAVGVVRLAAYNHHFSMWSFAWGNSPQPRTLEAHADVFADYTEGQTFLRVRVDGFQYGRYCWDGYDEGNGWCADTAHPDIAGWRSQANQRVESQVLNGCYTSTVMIYVDGSVRENYPIGYCYYPPPPPYEPATNESECSEVSAYYGWEWYYWNGETCSGPSSPILIATGNSRTYTLDRQASVAFDIDADGDLDQVAWTKRNSDVAFLAVDRNGNGLIDDGRELLGSATVPGKRTGFDALRTLAGGLEMGHLNAENGGELWTSLLLWHDRNQDGISGPGELSPASSVLEAIGLGYETLPRKDGVSNTFRYRGWARKLAAPGQGKEARTLGAPAREFDIFDVYLAYR
jgi:hypothetical protein